MKGRLNVPHLKLNVNISENFQDEDQQSSLSSAGM